MNEILHACGLSSDARWIISSYERNHRVRLMCSECGNVITAYEFNEPIECNACHAFMETSDMDIRYENGKKSITIPERFMLDDRSRNTIQKYHDLHSDVILKCNSTDIFNHIFDDNT